MVQIYGLLVPKITFKYVLVPLSYLYSTIIWQ